MILSHDLDNPTLRGRWDRLTEPDWERNQETFSAFYSRVGLLAYDQRFRTDTLPRSEER